MFSVFNGPQSMEVCSPPGTIVGTVEQEWSILRPWFRVKDATGNVVLKIRGPKICVCSCCGDVEFNVMFSVFYYI